MDDDLIYENVIETCSPKLPAKSGSQKNHDPSKSEVVRSPPYGEESPVDRTPDCLHSKRLLSPVTSLELSSWRSNTAADFGDAYENPTSVREKKVSISPSIKSDMYLTVVDADLEQVYDNPLANADLGEDVGMDEGKRFSLADLHRGSNDSASHLVPDERHHLSTPVKKVKLIKENSISALGSDAQSDAKQNKKFSIEYVVSYMKDHLAVFNKILVVVTFLISILAFLMVLIVVSSVLPFKCKCPISSHEGGSITNFTMYVDKALKAMRLSCPSSWIEYKNACYSPVMDEEKGYASAAKSCQSYGGHLSTINSEEENRFITENIVKTYVTDAKALLIGLTSDKFNSTDAYVWDDGAKVTFLNNLMNISASGNRKCFGVNSAGEWIAAECLRHAIYFCERPILKQSGG